MTPFQKVDTRWDKRMSRGWALQRIISSISAVLKTCRAELMMYGSCCLLRVLVWQRGVDEKVIRMNRIACLIQKIGSG